MKALYFTTRTAFTAHIISCIFQVLWHCDNTYQELEDHFQTFNFLDIDEIIECFDTTHKRQPLIFNSSG